MTRESDLPVSGFLSDNWRWMVSTVGVPTLILGYLLWQGIPFIGLCITNNTAALNALKESSAEEATTLGQLLLKMNADDVLADKRQREIITNEQVIYDLLLQRSGKLVHRLPTAPDDGPQGRVKGSDELGRR